MTRRRTFGKIRKLPSGRHQASYADPVSGERVNAPTTFATKTAAANWLAETQADMSRGAWHSPGQGQIPLGQYLTQWLDTRTDIDPDSTLPTYRTLTRYWINSDLAGINLGAMPIRDITPPVIRAWHHALTQATRDNAIRLKQSALRRKLGHPARAWAKRAGMEVADAGQIPKHVHDAWRAAGSPEHPLPDIDPAASGPGSTAAAMSYKLVRAALNQAIRDGQIRTNPCAIRNAATPRPATRSIAGPAEVDALAAAMPDRYSAAIPLAAWSSIRSSELFGLQRKNVDFDRGGIAVMHQLKRNRQAGMKATKTRERERFVALPGSIMQLLADHMARFTGTGPDDLVFTTQSGRAVNASNFRASFHRARRHIDRADLHFHDLRHTGATFATQSGATPREVQARLGHSTMQAAMRYQHALTERDRLIAERMDQVIRDADNVIPIRRAL